MSLDDRYRKCRAMLESRGQAHVLGWWDSLALDMRDQLLREIESVPWSLVDSLMETHLRNTPDDQIPANLQPAAVWGRHPAHGRQELYAAAASLGKQLLSAGKVAAFTVAGGQGTRLGFDGPKGTVTVTPVREKTLFQLFAEMTWSARNCYRVPIPWYIMTSPGNHQQTIGFLEDHEYFGIPAKDVIVFRQRVLPRFDLRGHLLMADRYRLALAPDGHGGSLNALATSGALQDMKDRGIEIASYFQVDNPLVQPFDEQFVGLHRITKSDMSTKVTPKVEDHERVGNVCLADGRVQVVEYSDLPEALARAMNADGTRKFNVGNLGIHLFEVDFIERLVGQTFDLPFHGVKKSLGFLGDDGFHRTPSSPAPNAIQFETFVFDALPLARNPLLLEIDRAEEFSPVKNAKGVASIETAMRDQIRRAARWLESAGAEIPYDATGEPAVEIEIAPTYALTKEDVQRKLTRPPKLHPGETLYMF